MDMQKNQILEIWVTGGIHAMEPVSVQPVSYMDYWQLIQVTHQDGQRSRHLFGRADNEGRVCSDIVAFDLKTITATTKSGRLYKVMGPPGRDADAVWIYDQWATHNKFVRVQYLTSALERLRRMRGYTGWV